MRKTKIICTYGPSISSYEMLKNVILAGANVIRFNFSHGDYEYHKRGMDLVKKIREELGRSIGILQDTKGPEIRTGLQDKEYLTLDVGKKVDIVWDGKKNTDKCIRIDYKELASDVHEGQHILIDDGRLKLKILDVEEKKVSCEVLQGGSIKERRGVNIPAVSLNLSFLSEKDKADLEFGADQGVDIVAASFTRNADDIKELRKFLYEKKSFVCDLIAKIENHEGVENIEEICFVADGIMVARGDLGVELPVEHVPRIQKHIVNRCRIHGIPVITATQMLESMVENARPTRAEVSDVANAIYDSTSAIMLSGETAAGKFPVECVEMMGTIALQTESDISYEEKYRSYFESSSEMTKAMANAALTTAYSLKASAIVPLTSTGYSARLVSRLRPNVMIIGATSNMRSYYRMSLYWGVKPFYIEKKHDTLGELFVQVTEKIEDEEFLPKGSLMVLLGGSPVGVSGSTNVLRISSVGNVATRGKVLVEGQEEGVIHIFKNKSSTPDNRILVMRYLLGSDLNVLKKAKGLILQGDKGEEMAKVAGETLGIPVISQCEGACKVLYENETVTMNASEGVVYRSR